MTKEMLKIVEHVLGNTFLVKNPLESYLFFYPVRLFRSAHLLDFEKKILPVHLFWSVRLLNFTKITSLLAYSGLLVYSGDQSS